MEPKPTIFTEQILTFKAGGQMYISTPLGVITMERLPEDSRKIKFTLPPSMKVFKGGPEALKKCEWVEIDPEGNLKPNFDMLIPVQDETGRLIGLTKPEAFRLEETSVKEKTDE